ncbi:hypothetical protein VNO78_11063 [Psophocarpus tetragonolobus]|uniref:Uncharacterized protein n=1 Tax=Psophocarpus tetragonolobus TaxID=3891 RepID=A0AAN9SKS1_PSOTE
MAPPTKDMVVYNGWGKRRKMKGDGRKCFTHIFLYDSFWLPGPLVDHKCKCKRNRKNRVSQLGDYSMDPPVSSISPNIYEADLFKCEPNRVGSGHPSLSLVWFGANMASAPRLIPQRGRVLKRILKMLFSSSKTSSSVFPTPSPSLL